MMKPGTTVERRALPQANYTPPPLPSLNALQAFESAARHQNFTRAARELGVTQTAVSHQVRSLELELGTALFRRAHQRVTLTPEGRAWALELSVVFGRLRELNRRLRQPAASLRPAVSVSVVPSFGSRWLVPRLGSFLLAHPDVDVRISASERLVDFAVEAVDVGIRYGLGQYPGLVTHKLAEDALVVVASPARAASHTRFTARALARETLLHDDFPNAWQRFFEAGGARLPSGVAHSELSDSSMVVEAALRGQGIALCRWSLVADELRAERLVRLYPELPALPTGLAYYLVSPRENLRRKVVATFRDWLLEQALALTPPPRAVAARRRSKHEGPRRDSGLR